MCFLVKMLQWGHFVTPIMRSVHLISGQSWTYLPFSPQTLYKRTFFTIINAYYLAGIRSTQYHYLPLPSTVAVPGFSMLNHICTWLFQDSVRTKPSAQNAGGVCHIFHLAWLLSRILHDVIVIWAHVRSGKDGKFNFIYFNLKHTAKTENKFRMTTDCEQSPSFSRIWRRMWRKYHEASTSAISGKVASREKCMRFFFLPRPIPSSFSSLFLQ